MPWRGVKTRYFTEPDEYRRFLKKSMFIDRKNRTDLTDHSREHARYNAS